MISKNKEMTMNRRKNNLRLKQKKLKNKKTHQRKLFVISFCLLILKNRKRRIHQKT